jgi:hypothetical protein
MGRASPRPILRSDGFATCEKKARLALGLWRRQHFRPQGKLATPVATLRLSCASTLRGLDAEGLPNAAAVRAADQRVGAEP